MKNIKCIKFNEGQHKGQYGWFHNSTADAHVKEGIAEYYNPEDKKEVKPEPEKVSDLPDDFPAKDIFNEAGKSFDDLKKLAKKGKLQSVAGVGQSTENKVMEYLDGND